jgi:dTDP-4-dehydrorhamnose 3,5-epimerase
MSRFNIINTPLNGLKIIERKVLTDERGFFERLFCHDHLSSMFEGKQLRQINHTLTHKVGTIRGLHFQYPPFSEVKLVTCLKGEVWDVAVDLRKDSPTFLKHFSAVLSEDNNTSLLIPEGFAHGFQTLKENSELIYFHTADYNKDFEGALNAIDPRVDIKWPISIIERSKKDTEHKMINDTFYGVEIK